MKFFEFQGFLTFLEGEKELSNIYFLNAEDTWQVEQIEKLLKQKFIQKNGENDSRMHILDGNTTSIKDIIAAMQNQSLFSSENFVSVRNGEKLKKNNIFLKYLGDIQNDYVLFLHWGGRKSKVLDAFKEYSEKEGISISLKKFTQAEISEIIKKTSTEKEISVENEVINRLCELSAHNMTVLSREMEKLFVVGEKTGVITIKDLAAYTSLETEYTGFQLSAAISQRNMRLCIEIASSFDSSIKSPVPVIIGILHSFFAKGLVYVKYRKETDTMLAKKLGVSPQSLFYVRRDYGALCTNFTGIQLLQSMELIKEYDLKSKGVNSYGLEENLLLDLLLKILLV